MSASIVSIRNFTKSFGQNKVIHDMEFEVFEGEVFAFLGANGSGKTTTIRCLLNIYEPTTGELLINGKKYGPEMSEFVGYLPEERGLYTSAKVLETMIYFGQLKGIDKTSAKKRAIEYLDRVGLSDKANAIIKQLSSGQQQKIQLGITIINEPKLLILDEPTKGLDPVNRGLLMDILNELNKQGSTIIFSTHQMDEAEKISDRLVMIKNGKRVLYGDTEKVKESFGDNTIHLEFSGKLLEENTLYSAKVDGHFAKLKPKENASVNDILSSLIDEKILIKSFQRTNPSLNEIFIEVTNSDRF